MNAVVSYTLFETAIGRCAIAWNSDGICAVSLPEATEAATRARIVRLHPLSTYGQPPATIAAAIVDIARLLKGERIALVQHALDESRCPDFDRQVYAITRGIPAGSTLTYGAIAKELGDPVLAQLVGKALGNNPIPIITPCHRVVGADGKLGGFSAPGGAESKRKLLLIERALPDEPLDLFES